MATALVLPMVAQSEQYSFQVSPASSQLTQSSVRQIFQDNEGMIWLLTQEGLNRYDGVSVTQYRPSTSSKNSLSHQAVTHIDQDGFETIWVATAGGGLNRFIKEIDGFDRPLGENGPRFIYGMTVDPLNRLWLGLGPAAPNLFAIYDQNSNELLPFGESGDSTARIFRLYQADAMLIGSDGENPILIAPLSEPSQIRPVHIFDENGAPVSNFRIHDIFVNSDDTLIIGTDNLGTFTLALEPLGDDLEYTARMQKRITQEETFSIHHSQSKHKFMLGTRPGLILLNEHLDLLETFDAFNSLIPDSQILDIIEDRSGLIWIGTFNGVAEGTKTLFELIGPNTALESRQVNSLLATETDTVLVGTSRGVFSYSLADNELRNVSWHGQNTSKLSNSSVMCFEETSSHFWIGTLSNGLYKVSKLSGEIFKFTNANSGKNLQNIGVTDIKNVNEKIYISTWGEGIFTASNDGIDLTNISIPDQAASSKLAFSISLEHDEYGNLWIGSDRGLFRYEIATEQITSIGNNTGQPNNLLSNVPWYLYLSPNKDLWIGTQSGALSKIEGASLTAPEPSIINLSDTLHFQSHDIYAVGSDEQNNIWFSHNKGVSKLDTKSLRIYNFLPLHGLQDSEFNHAVFSKTRNGSLIFGGNKGFNVINPSTNFEGTFRPNLVFTRVLTGGRKIFPSIQENAQMSLTLPNQYEDLSLEFSALDFLNPSNINYQYRISSLSERWIDLQGVSSLSLPALTPGRHAIEIQSTNSYGEWLSNKITANITINPPMYLTNTAYIFYAFLIISISLYLRYLSQRKWRLAQSHQELLESEVKKRTKELADAKAVAEKANQAKTQFISTISHEIRTPLHGILGIKELLEKTKLSNEQRNYVDSIGYSGQRLLLTLTDILDFSKLEAGRMEVNDESFNCVDLVEETIFLYHGFAAQSGNELTADWTFESDREVISDQQKIRQMIANLVSNSIKFTHKGKVHISLKLTTAEQDKSANLLMISVADTGVGVNKDEIATLSQAFSQASTQSFSKNIAGTGLGLSIVQKFSALLGGDLKIHSKEGRGTKVALFIPVSMTDKHAHKVPFTLPHIQESIGKRDAKYFSQQLHRVYGRHTHIAPIPALNDIETVNLSSINNIKTIHWSYKNRPNTHDSLSYPTTSELLIKSLGPLATPELPKKNENTEKVKHIHALKVLVVDDVEINRKIMSETLKYFGIDCELASDGIEALEKYNQNSHDLIFMDCQMPRMDGLEATRTIRNYPSDNGTEPFIIAVTAGTSGEERDACINSGMNLVIAKPFTHEKIALLIKEISGENGLPIPTELEAKNLEEIFDKSVIDQILSIFKDSPENFDALLESYKKAIFEKAALLENSSDMIVDNLLAIGHAIKSASLNIGAVKLANIGKDIEAGKSTDNYRELRAVIENSIYEFKSTVMQYAEDKFFDPR
ncbi:MAG: ATP-binding protein [Halieaceae bacterium]|nr:ATP-binding protein [Halieaceae bacterium]